MSLKWLSSALAKARIARAPIPGVRIATSVIAISIVATGAGAARAAGPTEGYPEAVVQWGVQKGETCEDISQALYGSPKHVALLHRYNRIVCNPAAPLPVGTTLIVPEKVTTLPDARLGAINPDVRARPAGGGWGKASVGMELYSNAGVNTLDKGRADVQFIDRTRVFLAPNTLVIIYGTAARTRVERTPPPVVEVESGELKAGLAALRGGSVEVGIKGGGRVSAASRDTVVERKGPRTTVAVFDGKAGVSSGGRSVEVPKNFGTRFVGTAPPVKPRPLPPAPEWASGGAEAIALAPDGKGSVIAEWKPAAGAIAYRVEVARDAGFNDLVAREEVPPSIHALRSENLPVGSYWVHVRAIDKEEYLGIAAERLVRLVDVRVDSGKPDLEKREILVNPYGILKLGSTSALEAAIDQSPFGPMPDTIDLQRRAPKEIALRTGTSAAPVPIALRYSKVAARVRGARSADGRSIAVSVEMDGFEGIDIRARVAPAIRAHLPEGVRVIPLAGPGAAPNLFSAVVEVRDPSLAVRLDVVDGRGAVLGTTDAGPRDAAANDANPAAPPQVPQIGAYLPLWQLSSVTDVAWTAPTAPAEAGASGGMVRVRGAWAFQGQVRASGGVGPVGFDAAIRSNTSETNASDASAWFGARARVFRLGNAELEIGPALRVGVPVVSTGAPARLDGAIAIGGAAGRFTWLADVGGRFRLSDDGGAAGAPPVQGYVLGGATFDPIPWMRLYALLDAHVIRHDSGGNAFLGGLGAGVEAGRAIFGGFAFRASPWPDAGAGAFSMQLSLGVRQVAP